MGLAWAFLRAGAHNVIGALWEVSDESTPRLMGSFYQGLEDGTPPATALRKAKIDLLHTKGELRKPVLLESPSALHRALGLPSQIRVRLLGQWAGFGNGQDG